MVQPPALRMRCLYAKGSQQHALDFVNSRDRTSNGHRHRALRRPARRARPPPPPWRRWSSCPATRRAVARPCWRWPASAAPSRCWPALARSACGSCWREYLVSMKYIECVAGWTTIPWLSSIPACRCSSASSMFPCGARQQPLCDGLSEMGAGPGCKQAYQTWRKCRRAAGCICTMHCVMQ